MHDSQFVLTLGAALACAFIGGLIARRLGQPIIVGYLLAGVVIGPSTPGFVADLETVRVLAELGVAFLMFSLGVDFSLAELGRVRRMAVGAGVIQILTVTLSFAAIWYFFEGSFATAIVFGMLTALSSSVVAVKLLMARGQTTTTFGRMAVALAIVQDLSLVIMLVMLPILANDGGNVLIGSLRAIVTAIVVIGLVFVLGQRLVPRVLEVVARTGSRELFLLSVIVIALGTALATERAGLSLALGAFLAGLIVSESDYSHQVLADIIPLRDSFATLFFVSVGMLIDLPFVLDHLAIVALLITLVIIGKVVMISVPLRMFGMRWESALLAGAVLCQIGEFSFILAQEARDLNIVGAADERMILAVSAGTLLLSPFVFQGMSWGAPRFLRGRENAALEVDADTVRSVRRGHTIVCGYGRLGAELVDALQRRGFACVVIDNDPAFVRTARALGIDAIFGEAGSSEILHLAGVERARILAVAMSDPLAAETAVRVGRAANPRLDIIARARSRDQLQHLRGLGATEVVQPEFEAGLEMIRHILHRNGLDQRQTSAVVQRRRERYYVDTTVVLDPDH